LEYSAHFFILSQFELTIVRGNEKDEKRKGKSNEREEKLGKCGEIIK
jgi:hypothetical protein